MSYKIDITNSAAATLAIHANMADNSETVLLPRHVAELAVAALEALPVLLQEKQRADNYRDELARRTGPGFTAPDCYPDEDLPIRILQEHLDANRSGHSIGHSADGSAEAIAKVMNEAAAERVEILSRAIAVLHRAKGSGQGG